jgi:hypothetical protein
MSSHNFDNRNVTANVKRTPRAFCERPPALRTALVSGQPTNRGSRSSKVGQAEQKKQATSETGAGEGERTLWRKYIWRERERERDCGSFATVSFSVFLLSLCVVVVGRVEEGLLTSAACLLGSTDTQTPYEAEEREIKREREGGTKKRAMRARHVKDAV